MTQHFNQETFQQAISSGKPVLVDFWATWCGPCRMMAPIIDELAADYEGRAIVGKVDVDEEGDLAQRYGIMSIPTMILFKDGERVQQIVGARPKAQIADMIDQAL